MMNLDAVGGAESTDQSNLDLQQGSLAWNGDRFSLRAGRQEVILGTSRLIAVREDPNIRLAFDGARASWKQGPYRIDALAFRPVFNKPEAFDDVTSKSRALYGLYICHIRTGKYCAAQNRSLLAWL